MMRLSDYWKIKVAREEVAKESSLETRISDLENSQEIQNQAIDELVEQSMEEN